MKGTPPVAIGKYQLKELLGQGSMGVVYRAFDPVHGHDVAIKVMGEHLSSDKELRKRFMREAEAAGSFKHPNIIAVHESGEADGHLYFVMEYVDGSDLSEIIERGDPLTLSVKLRIISDVLHALEYAHAGHVVHRDIKPANIRVGADGRAKLMDFGIAHLESSVLTVLTQAGSLMGTPNYMAPEQVTSGRVTPATDIFAIGAVLYELLSGRRCFDGDALMKILFKVVNEQPPPLSTLVPGLPPGLQAIVEKALAKDPLARYAHGGLMAADLSALR